MFAFQLNLQLHLQPFRVPASWHCAVARDELQDCLGVAPLGGLGIDDADGGSGHCVSTDLGERTTVLLSGIAVPCMQHVQVNWLWCS